MILKKLINRLINLYYKLISPFYRLLENQKIRIYGNRPLKHQPIFIIGAPRTGSTLLYQAITNKFDVLYIDNLVGRWHRNFFHGFEKSMKKFRNEPHNVFRSFHGDTSMYNLHAPSECGEFWYRWFPKDHHFLDTNEIEDNKLEEIRQNITAVSNYHNKPIVFKNLNAGQRLRIIVRMFPEAKFIWIRRNYVDTCYSIIKSKRKLGLKLDDFWSIMPRNVEDLKKMEGYKQIALQVYNIDKQISIDKTLFPDKNFLTLDYDDFLNDNSKITYEIKQFIGANISERQNADEIEFNYDQDKLLNLERKKIKRIIEDLKLGNGFN